MQGYEKLVCRACHGRMLSLRKQGLTEKREAARLHLDLSTKAMVGSTGAHLWEEAGARSFSDG